MEIDRDGPSYSIETVDALKAQSGDAEIFLVGGSDAFAGIGSWHEWARLLDEVGFVIIPRTPASVKEALAALGSEPEVVLVTGLAQLDISSTDIRARSQKACLSGTWCHQESSATSEITASTRISTG